MKNLGKFSHISNKGNIIFKSINTPPMGALVFTENKKRFGKINRIFGPTKEAYISVRPFKNFDLLNFDEKLFLSKKSSKKRGRRKRQKK